MKRNLKSKGKSVKDLFFIDTFHPEILIKEVDEYQTKKRILFYLKRLFEENAQNKKARIKHLINRWKSLIMSLFKKDGKHPVFRQLQELLGIHIDKNKLSTEDRNQYLSFKFRPKPYKGDMLLISALHLRMQENIIKWRNNISGKLYTHEVTGYHKSLINEPGVKPIAQIINKHLAKY